VIILYHGFAMKALDPALLSQAIIIREPGDDAPAAQASVPVQMSLMAFSEGVQAPVKTRGHAMPSGTGPRGETCGSCASVRRRNGGGRNYTKCSLTMSKWTAGAGSDVRLRDPACSKWTQRFGQS
jgi:hypothetical protein